MNLKTLFQERELELIAKAGVIIEEREYSEEELGKIEKILLNHLNQYEVDEKNDLTSVGCEYEELIEKLTDLEEENKVGLKVCDFVAEEDKVELIDGRRGFIIDITNDIYTIEVDKMYQTGKVEEDIVICNGEDIARMIPIYEGE